MSDEPTPRLTVLFPPRKTFFSWARQKNAARRIPACTLKEKAHGIITRVFSRKKCDLLGSPFLPVQKKKTPAMRRGFQ
jgi:hypothetical protein